MTKSVYLAGPITGESYGTATDWRQYASEIMRTYGVEGLSPLRHKEYLTQEVGIKDVYDQIMSTQRAITTRDRFDCLRCDMGLVYLKDAKRVSIGTMLELAWMDSQRTPFVVVMEPGNLHDHAMVREISSFIVPDLDQGLDVVRRILVP